MSESETESLGNMPPDQIRFSQRSINYRFGNGKSVDDLAEELRTGTVSPEAVTPIRLVEEEGTYFTLDNRRLEAFRRAGVAIPCRLATLEEIDAERWKFTTDNGGVSVRVRGEPDERSS